MSIIISKNVEEFRKQTFLKPCVIKDGRATFQHRLKLYVVTADCFKDLEGKTVLIDTALHVYRSEKKIGEAEEVRP